MKIKSLFALAYAGFSLVSTLHATTITEDFSHNPASDGWQVFGDSNLFAWDSVHHDLMVTWDSTQTNSYFYHPLGAILDTNYDYSFAFDLLLTDYSAQGYSFAVAAGLQNFSDASDPNFLVGTGMNSTNLAEFDFYPDTLDATDYITNSSVDLTFLDTQNDYSPFADAVVGVPNGIGLPTNVVMRVTMNYTAFNETGTLTVSTNGVSFASATTTLDPPVFGNCILDTFSVESYSGLNSYAVLLAHGTVGNIAITFTPPPPVRYLQAAVISGVGQVQFSGLTNWNYTLQSSTNLQTWFPAGPIVSGTYGAMILQDTNSLQAHEFYRVNAEKSE